MKPILTGLLLFVFILPGHFLTPSASAQTSGWLWGRGNTGAGIDAYAVATDPAGNVYGGGINYEDSTAYFGSIALPDTATTGGPGGFGYTQAVWIKYSSTGTPLWAGGSEDGDAWLFNLTTDASGNLIVFGSFDSPIIKFGSTVLTNANYGSGGDQYFLAKYSPTGTLLWAIADGSASVTYYYFLAVCILTAGGVTTDAAGNIYITSSFDVPTMTIDGHTYTNTSTGGTNDFFVAKYNSSGVFQWASTAGGASDDLAFGITIGNAGNVYVTGAFWSASATIGSSTIANPYGGGGYLGGVPMAFIAEFSPAGTPLWAEGAGGANGAYGMGLVSDASGNVYMTGGFEDASISFGSATINRYYPGVSDLALYLVQFSPSNTVTWSKTIGSSTSGVWGFAIALAGCGEVWVSGNYTDDATIDSTHTLGVVPGGDPVFIVGYSLGGAVIGYSGLGSGGDDQNGIACDANGNVFICSDYMSGSPLTIGPDVLPSLTGYEMLYVGKYANVAIAPPDTTYEHSDTTLCYLTSLTLTAPASYSSYLWDNATTLATRTVTASGTYWVVCTSTCAIPTVIDTFDVIITNNDTTHHTTDTTFCTHAGAVTLSADAGFNTYNWSTGSTSSSISVSSNGTYYLAEGNGCAMGFDTFNVTLSPPVQVALPNDTSLCQGQSLTLYYPEPAGVSYQWSTGSTDSAIVVTGSSEYSVTVSALGCSASASVNVIFNQPPAPFNLGPDTTVCNEPTYTLSSGNSATVWNTGQKGSSIDVSYSGLFTATISNECGTTTDSVRVTFGNCVLLIPSAFTPNNDGKDDIFKVVGLLLDHYDGFSLSVYNRYGQRLFYTDDINEGWNGIFNGTPQDLGTYFYLVSYTLNGQKHMLKGDFELVR